MRAPLPFSRLSVHRKVILILALIVLPVVGMMVLYLNTLRQSLAVQKEVDSLFEIQVQTDAILSMVVDVQDGFRGFVLVRKEKFLEPFHKAEEAFDPAINELKQMVRDDHEQLQRISQIEAQVHALLEEEAAYRRGQAGRNETRSGTHRIRRRTERAERNSGGPPSFRKHREAASERTESTCRTLGIGDALWTHWRRHRHPGPVVACQPLAGPHYHRSSRDSDGDSAGIR